MTEVIALLEARIAHLASELTTNPRSEYARIQGWRLKEAQHLLGKIKELAEKAK